MKFNILIAFVALTLFGCVDDYNEYNDAVRLDAPTLRISATGSNQLLVTNNVNAWQRTYTAYVLPTEPSEFTVSVIDAPGKVGAVSVTSSVPEFGTITVDEASVAALIGKEQGEFKFTFTPNQQLPNQNSTDRPFNIAIAVSDAQQNDKGVAAAKTTTLTVPAVVVGPCLSQTVQTGFYKVIDASGNLDGGTPFTLADIEEVAGSAIVVSVTNDRPGVYTFQEITGGIWPNFYSGRATPNIKVDACNNTITSREGANITSPGTAVTRTFTVNGTVNEDGTITVQWSYVLNSGATPANPAQGTYTLQHYSTL